MNDKFSIRALIVILFLYHYHKTACTNPEIALKEGVKFPWEEVNWTKPTIPSTETASPTPILPSQPKTSSTENPEIVPYTDYHLDAIFDPTKQALRIIVIIGYTNNTGERLIGLPVLLQPAP